MAIRDITIDVDFAKKDILTKFNVKQFDNANLTINTFLDNVEYNPIGNTCKFYVGIDDDLFLQEENIQVQENKIVIKLNGNIISRSGMAYAELELKNSEGVMTSITFIFYVDKKIGEGATLPINIDGFVAKYERLIEEFKSKVDSTVKNCNDRVDNKLIQLQKDYDTTKNTTIKSIEDKTDKVIDNVNKAIASGTVDLETKEARDGEVSLNKRLIRDKQELSTRISEISEVVAYDYSSDNGYINIKNSKEGTLDNVRIEGNTVVNLSNKENFYTDAQASYNESEKCIIINTTANQYSNFWTKSNGRIKPSTEYTIIVDVLANNSNGLIAISAQNSTTSSFVENITLARGFVGRTVHKVTSKADFSQLADNAGLRSYFNNDVAEVGKTVKVKIMLLEGDYTQNPPSYFEGLKSVGELEELEITSVNENLFDVSVLSPYIIGTDTDGTVLDYPSIATHKLFSNSFESNTQYTLKYRCKETVGSKNPRFRFNYTDGTFSNVHTLTSSTMTEYKANSDNNKTVKSISVTFSSGGGNWVVDLDSVMLRRTISTDNYTPHKSDKKKLLYKDNDGTWKPVILREWDYIEELADGRCKYHRGSGEKVLNSESVINQVDNTSNSTDILRFAFTKSINAKDKSSFICNRFKTLNYVSVEQLTEECIIIHTSLDRVDTCINKSKLSSPNVDGLKVLLKEWSDNGNPLTVVYQLAQEQVYDCIDLSLNSFNGETSVFTNSSIPHKLTVTQKQGLKARVETLEQEMKFMYDNFREGLARVLSGDMQSLAYMLYPQDFTDYDNNDTDEDIPITIPNLK